MKQFTDTDNPIDNWTDEQLAEAARNTLKTLGEIAGRLRRRGYWVSVDSHGNNYIPSRFNANKQVQL